MEESVDYLLKGGNFQGLEISNKDGILTIRLNRPKKYNAFNGDLFIGVRDVLACASSDETVKLVYITGTGKYFTSGMDMTSPPSEKTTKAPTQVFKEFVEAIINFPKTLVAGVNGPAVGIGVTMLPLLDFVYVSDSATFQTPFVKLGLCPEACSSYTFPKIMGCIKAKELLLASKKLSAREAYEQKLVTEIFGLEEFEEKVQQRLSFLKCLPPGAMACAKGLIDSDKEILLQINEKESEELRERISSEEFTSNILKFMMRKTSKL